MRARAGPRRVAAVPLGASRREGFTTESAESTEEGRDEEMRRCRDEDAGGPSKGAHRALGREPAGRIHHRGAEDTEENRALKSPVGALYRAQLGSM